jgi:hypothetical protein
MKIPDHRYRGVVQSHLLERAAHERRAALRRLDAKLSEQARLHQVEMDAKLKAWLTGPKASIDSA